MSETKVVGVRVTKAMANLITAYLKKDTHLSSAEFLRAAIREKLQREAPDLYSRLFKEAAELG